MNSLFHTNRYLKEWKDGGLDVGIDIDVLIRGRVDNLMLSGEVDFS